MKTSVLVGAGIMVVAVGLAALPQVGQTAPGHVMPDTASRPIDCHNLSGTITTSGVVPSIDCLSGADGTSLNVTTRATPMATPAPSSHSEVHLNQNSSTSTSSTNVTIDNSQSAGSSGNASSSSSSSVNINISN